jgi:hypothetical protein
LIYASPPQVEKAQINKLHKVEKSDNTHYAVIGISNYENDTGTLLNAKTEVEITYIGNSLTINNTAKSENLIIIDKESNRQKIKIPDINYITKNNFLTFAISNRLISRTSGGLSA